MKIDYLPVKLEELREIPTFRILPPEQAQSLASVIARRHYAPGQISLSTSDAAVNRLFIPPAVDRAGG